VTALEALNAILEAGGRMEPGPERTRLLSPPKLRALVEANRAALRPLVDAYGHCPADVFRRAQAFRRQIDEWATSNRPGVPLLVLPGSPAPLAGQCVSCGTTIEAGWRCGVCLRAVHVALALADTEPEEPTPAPPATCSRHPVTPRPDPCDTCRATPEPETPPALADPRDPGDPRNDLEPEEA